MDIVLDRISELKKRYKPLYANFYYNINKMEVPIGMVEKEKTISFCIQEGEIKRVYFVSADRRELEETLRCCKKGVSINFVGKAMPMGMDSILEASGYVRISTFKRFSNSAIKEFSFEKIFPSFGINARPSDSRAVLEKLQEIFNPYTSHLPNIGELEGLIEKECVIIEKEDGEITAILIYKIEGRKFYINQIYNGGEKEVIHSILQGALRKAVEKEVDYCYAWVDEKNIASIRFHNKYGLEFDGMLDFTYVKEMD